MSVTKEQYKKSLSTFVKVLETEVIDYIDSDDRTWQLPVAPWVLLAQVGEALGESLMKEVQHESGKEKKETPDGEEKSGRHSGEP